jgi:hypothetical protein
MPGGVGTGRLFVLEGVSQLSAAGPKLLVVSEDEGGCERDWAFLRGAWPPLPTRGCYSHTEGHTWQDQGVPGVMPGMQNVGCSPRS